MGRLGLCSLSKHSPAAYLSSRSCCVTLCQELDPQHTWEGQDPSSAVHHAAQGINEVSGSEIIGLNPVPKDLKQWVLSSEIDAGSLRQLTDPQSTNLSFRAHMSLLGLEGAGTWLHAIPSEALGTKIAPPLYVPMLQRRLRIPFFEEPFFCPLCDGVMDVWADHALTCACGGDRTKRHNLVRNTFARLAASAGWQPELEKPGLLHPRPSQGGRSEDGSEGNEGGQRLSARRPADVYIPRWDLGGSAALDFAVTSGLRADLLEQTAAVGLSCLTLYEDHKKTFLDTEKQCANEGIAFLPFVLEAHSGSWGPTATKVLLRLGKSISMISGESTALEALRARQNLGLVLQRETARAVLRRSPVLAMTDDQDSAYNMLSSTGCL